MICILGGFWRFLCIICSFLKNTHFVAHDFHCWLRRLHTLHIFLSLTMGCWVTLLAHLMQYFECCLFPNTFMAEVGCEACLELIHAAYKPPIWVQNACMHFSLFVCFSKRIKVLVVVFSKCRPKTQNLTSIVSKCQWYYNQCFITEKMQSPPMGYFSCCHFLL